jgi:exodeoxyribonuclease VII large subunit
LSESFFEFRDRLTSAKGKPQAAPTGGGGAGGAQRQTLTVTQLTRQIDQALKTLPQTFYVRAEVSNFNAHAGSGHLYFTLKDANACIDCVMFRSDAERLKFTPTDGMELLATGSVKVYAQRGRYQLYVTRLEPLGKGALELAFQQMRKKLEAEGLFAPARKKPIPPYPLRIALVTASQAAALQDMLKVLRRFRWLRLMLYPVPVQGAGAAEKIARALRDMNTIRPDVVLLARGGGSLEDLWAFNEEVVARAVAASAVPIVTGIGHEVDTSIADLVADKHTHTPTEAAQVITAQWRLVSDGLAMSLNRLARCVRDQVTSCRHRLDGVRRHEFFRRPMDIVNVLRQRLDDRQQSLRVAMNARVWNVQRDLNEFAQSLAAHHPRHAVTLSRQRVEAIAQRLAGDARADHQRRLSQLDALDHALRAVSPESVLRRGFSLTTLKKDGTIVRSAGQISGGERLVTRLADGTVESTADDPKQPKLFD